MLNIQGITDPILKKQETNINNNNNQNKDNNQN